MKPSTRLHLAGALGLMLALGGCHPADESAEAPKPAPSVEAGIEADAVALPISTEEARVRPLAVEVSAVATIAPIPGRSAELGFKAGGRIHSLAVREGERVAAGQVLGVLVERKVASAELATARANAERDAALFHKGIVARRRMEASRLEVQRAEQALLGTDLRAPFSGTVVRLRRAPGEYVDPTSSVLTLMDLTTVYAIASVYENDLAGFVVGRSVAVTTLAAPGRRFSGRIALISDVLDPASRTFQVKVHVPNRDGTLKAGMSARVLAREGERRVLTVPAEAVLDGPGGKQVFVREGDRYEARPVETGEQAEGWIEVKEGLKPGEPVVTKGQFELKASLSQGAIPTDDD